jgi:hypothetical protein
MGTEKGRSARLKAEREARENTRGMNSQGFYSEATSIREVEAYQRRKYAGLNERVSGKSYEGRLPATHLLPAEHVKERIGDHYPNLPAPNIERAGNTFPGMPDLNLHPSQCQKVAKKHLNMPTPDTERQRHTQGAIPEYDPTRDMHRKRNAKRPYLGDTHNKLKHKLPTTTVSE